MGNMNPRCANIHHPALTMVDALPLPPPRELTCAALTAIALDDCAASVFVRALDLRGIATLLTVTRNISAALSDRFFLHVLRAPHHCDTRAVAYAKRQLASYGDGDVDDEERACATLRQFRLARHDAWYRHHDIAIDASLMRAPAQRSFPPSWHIIRSRGCVSADTENVDFAAGQPELRGTIAEYYAARTGWLFIHADPLSPSGSPALASALTFEKLGPALAHGISIAIDPRISLPDPRAAFLRNGMFAASHLRISKYNARREKQWLGIATDNARVCGQYPIIVCVMSDDAATISRTLAHLEARTRALGARITESYGIHIPHPTRRYTIISPVVYHGPYPQGVPLAKKSPSIDVARHVLRRGNANLFIEGEPFFIAIPFVTAPPSLDLAHEYASDGEYSSEGIFAGDFAVADNH